jgi:large conductance mechanosensitive channel
VAAAIYFLVVTPMNELAKRRKKEEAPAAPPEPPEEVKLLREILEELRKKA